MTEKVYKGVKDDIVTVQTVSILSSQAVLNLAFRPGGITSTFINSLYSSVVSLKIKTGF